LAIENENNYLATKTFGSNVSTVIRVRDFYLSLKDGDIENEINQSTKILENLDFSVLQILKNIQIFRLDDEKKQLLDEYLDFDEYTRQKNEVKKNE